MTPWLRSDSKSHRRQRESRSGVPTRSPQVFPTFTIAGRENMLTEPCLADLCAFQAQRSRERRTGRVRLSARRRVESLVVTAPSQEVLPRAISLVLDGSAVSLQPGPSRDKERCSAESSERSSLATTPEPRRDRLGSLPTPRPRFPPPSIPTVGHLVAPGQTHSGNLSLCLIAGREFKAVRVAWPMRRTASPGYRTVTLSGCPTSRMGHRDAKRTAE